jgi:hypothetical protein
MGEISETTKNHINELGRLTLLEQLKYVRGMTEEEFASLVEHWESFEPCDEKGSIDAASLPPIELSEIAGDVEEKRKRWFY